MIKCKFCEIIDSKANAVIIYNNNNIISFLDNNPFNIGHTLVVPKKHYKFFMDMPEKEAGDLFIIVNRITKAIFLSVKSDGINIGQSNGISASQQIFHVHIHIIPRFKNDTENDLFPIRKKINEKDLQKTGDNIIKVLNKFKIK